MRPALLATLALVLFAGCGVETVEIERRPASAFADDPAQRQAYAAAERRCGEARSLDRLAREVGTRKENADVIARTLAEENPDAGIAGAAYSGCLDGIEAAKLE